jgi:hypothetical protein
MEGRPAAAVEQDGLGPGFAVERARGNDGDQKTARRITCPGIQDMPVRPAIRAKELAGGSGR